MIIINLGTKISFTRKMEECIVQGKWLTDEHIGLAQNLLKMENPTLYGFQSSLLCQIDGFLEVKGDSIQIHNINNNHWVTSHSRGDEIFVYDSHYNGEDLSPSLMHQLVIIYKGWSEKEEDEITLSFSLLNVRQQDGASDCGLFAIAFAVHAALGDVSQVTFDQPQMRITI